MFEGYSRNKYASAGVIQWMINSAWPSLVRQLYDYYLRPGGGEPSKNLVFFVLKSTDVPTAKKSCQFYGKTTISRC